MRKYNHPPVESLSLEQVLYALSDPVRLSLVENISKNGEQSCGALTVNIAKSTASHHFRVLREAGILYMEPQGKQYINSLRKEELDSRFPGVLDAILNSI